MTTFGTMLTAAGLARVQPLHVDGRGGMRCNLRWKISGPPLPDGYVPARVRQWRYIGRGCDFPVEIHRRYGEDHAVVSAVLAMNLHFACNDIVPLTALVGMDRDLCAPPPEEAR